MWVVRGLCALITRADRTSAFLNLDDRTKLSATRGNCHKASLKDGPQCSESARLLTYGAPPLFYLFSTPHEDENVLQGSEFLWALPYKLALVVCIRRTGFRLFTSDESWGLGLADHAPIIRGSKIRALRPCFSSIGRVTPWSGGDAVLGMASHRATTQHPCTVNTPAAENLQVHPQRRRHLNLPPLYRIPHYLRWLRSASARPGQSTLLAEYSRVHQGSHFADRRLPSTYNIAVAITAS